MKNVVLIELDVDQVNKQAAAKAMKALRPLLSHFFTADELPKVERDLSKQCTGVELEDVVRKHAPDLLASIMVLTCAQTIADRTAEGSTDDAQD